MPETVRLSQIPVKGERGLQKKYTEEQRKNIYLERLSRKSIKNAEKEIVKVNEVLDSVEHNPDKLREAERDVKNKLKLINYAKYFTNSAPTNITNVKERELKETNPRRRVLKKSAGPEVSTDRGGSSSQSIGTVRRRGSRSESSGSDDSSGASSVDSD